MQKNGVSNGSFDWAGVKKRIADAGVERVFSRAEKDAILAERARLLARPRETLTAQKLTGLRLATFALTGERYGLEARLVIEISRLTDFTPLPHAPDHLVGITNLRGEILPVFDLRALLGLSRRALDDMSRLVVLGRGRAEFGVLADSTRELVVLPPNELLPPPPSVSDGARHFMRGVTKDALVVLDGEVLLDDRRLYCDQGDDKSV
ncbi:MAG: chemotaxis protein CheW [Polyangiaceae bacterium]